MNTFTLKTTIHLIAVALLLTTASCRTYEIHQGNVMKDESIWAIQVGDSRFKVESLLGSPALKDPLRPNRVRYVEDHRNIEEDEDTGTTEQEKLRAIEITYDDALRVKKIDYFGFEGMN
jgi:outer membrane protein assembly factor BamE (lipoprotein component of BamABCDE complex)